MIKEKKTFFNLNKYHKKHYKASLFVESIRECMKKMKKKKMLLKKTMEKNSQILINFTKVNGLKSINVNINSFLFLSSFLSKFRISMFDV
jgi:hypothetical protein